MGDLQGRGFVGFWVKCQFFSLDLVKEFRRFPLGASKNRSIFEGAVKITAATEEVREILVCNSDPRSVTPDFGGAGGNPNHVVRWVGG